MIRKKETKKGIRWSYVIELGAINGERKRIQKGGFLTKKEAQIAKAKVLEELENGGIFKESDISMNEFLDYWYENYVKLNCKHHTQLSYSNTIKHLKKSFGNYKLKNLTPIMIQNYVNQRFKNGASINTLKNFKIVFKTAMKYAIFPCEFIKENPLQNIIIPKRKEEKEKIEVISLKQFQELISLVPEQPRYKLAFLIAFHTGMRVSEVCGLTWDNVDLKNNILHIKHNIIYYKGTFTLSSTKSKSSERIIIIGDSLKNILMEEKERQKELKKDYRELYYKGDNFVCCHDSGKPTSPTSIVNLCAYTLIKRGLSFKFNFHMLRHTHATLLMEAGANIVDISKRLGHKNTSITLDIYSHVTQKMKNDTVDIFEKLIK